MGSDEVSKRSMNMSCFTSGVGFVSFGNQCCQSLESWEIEDTLENRVVLVLAVQVIKPKKNYRFSPALVSSKYNPFV